MPCGHHNFHSEVGIARMEDIGRFQADVRIRCADCDCPFRFIGLPLGLDINGAAVSVDGCEARLAIHPVGVPVPDLKEETAAGFRILNNSPEPPDAH